MSSIDRVAAQDAARTYAQNTDTTRAAATTAAAQHAASLANLQNRAHRSDSVTLSDNARSVATGRQAVKNSPDVREQKVADIKQQLSDGTYQVSARALATKMLATSSSRA
jgi:flagellar biosynthesis anti-sigma factor FlgM